MKRKIYNTTFSRNDNNKKKKVVDSVNSTSYQQTKFEKVNNNNDNRTLIIGFSNCVKTYLKNLILLRKQEPISINTKPLNQFLNIKAQTSGKIQALNEFENSTVVFDDMLLSKQESFIDLFFTRGHHKNIDTYYISQSYFHLPKSTLFNNS